MKDLLSESYGYIFEEALPQISDDFTKDYFDYLALGLGAGLFWGFGDE